MQLGKVTLSSCMQIEVSGKRWFMPNGLHIAFCTVKLRYSFHDPFDPFRRISLEREISFISLLERKKVRLLFYNFPLTSNNCKEFKQLL